MEAQFPIFFCSATSKPFFLRKYSPLIYFNMDKIIEKGTNIMFNAKKQSYYMLERFARLEIYNFCSQMRKYTEKNGVGFTL